MKIAYGRREVKARKEVDAVKWLRLWVGLTAACAAACAAGGFITGLLAL